MAMLPNNTRIALMQELTVHIDLDRNFNDTQLEQELEQFVAELDCLGNLVPLHELFE